MCTNRLYIKSNSLNLNPLVDRFYNYVPCGKCDECLATKQADISTRLLYHCDFVKDSNGLILYFTLTYDRYNVPKFNDKFVFSKLHVRKFIDQFRHTLKYPKFFDYFITSEYGDDKFRPHYHGIFFFRKFLDFNKIKSDLERLWYYGRVDFSQNNGRVLGSRPAKYVSKYVGKNVSLAHRLSSKKFFDEEAVESFLFSPEARINDLSILPFHFISNGVGFSMVSHIKFDDLVNGFIFRNDDTGFHKKVMIPQYILRKLLKYTFRNKNGSISYRYNDLGLAVLSSRLKKRYSDLALEYLHLFDFGLNYFHDITYLKNRFAYDEFKEFCKNYANIEFCKRVAGFTLLYNGLACSDFTNDFNHDVDVYVSNYGSGEFREDFRVIDNLDFVVDILDHIRSYMNYLKYKDRCLSFNARQLLLSKKTGKFKPVLIKNFSVYNNLNYKNKCLSMLTKKLAKSA